MLIHYLKIAWRNLNRYKIFSVLNISGLAIGITCCLVIGLFIRDELSYDRQNKDADRIYRVVADFVNDNGTSIPGAATPPALAAALQKDIPEIEQVTRLFPDPGIGSKFFVRTGKKKFLEANLYHADSSIFNMFTLPFLKGDKKTALDNPNGIVLTASTANKYFGDENPIGKILEVDDWQPQVVTGVIEDIPNTSHFKFDLLVPLRRFMTETNNNNWGWYSYYTYIKLRRGSDILAVNKKIQAIFKKNQPENKNKLYTQALTAIHLSSNLKSEIKPNSDSSYIYIFGTIALCVLLIACINYINLATARATVRAKEIGIRKISGALKNALVGQFLIESLLTALLAAPIALGIAALVLPFINEITGKQLSLIAQHNYLIPLYVFLFVTALGLVVGCYPALYLSAFDPLKALKGQKLPGLKNISFRKALVVLQFCISITLIIGTIIIIQQVNFIQHARLGLNKENIIIVNDVYYLTQEENAALKNEWMQIPGVKRITAANGIPGGRVWTNEIKYRPGQGSLSINALSVDADFIDVYGMELKEGRNFSKAPFADTAYTIILNETAVKQLGIVGSIIGQQIFWRENPQTKQRFFATVIGVVKDFHYSSMRNEIMPFAFVNSNKHKWNYAIKLEGENIYQTIASAKKVWDNNVTSRPFQYSFLDETYASLYASEMNFKKIFTGLTVLSIFIACLGLFGLSSFVIGQRTKEIGIRKVLGCTVPGIVRILSVDFIHLVFIASIISFPVAWWVMHHWLRDFAYRVSISVWIFPGAGMLVLFIAMATISFQSIKMATSNPVKSLQSE